MAGHLWEQTILPLRTGKRLLWSPANTGPLTVERQVLTVHDVATLDHPEWFEPKFAKWYGLIIPALARRVRCLITASEFSKQRILANTNIEEARIKVIPHGVSERFFAKDYSPIDDMRSRLGIRSDRYVLTVGSIEPRKNLARLLEAWSLSASRLPEDVWLVIAGAKGKDHIFAATNLGKIPPRVYLTGFVGENDLPALYRGALAMVYPSIYEGFGLPVLEAMAAGTVAVAGNTTALPEVAGDASMLVDPYDAPGIAAAIERLVLDANFRETLRQRGLARSRQFNWERAAASTLCVLRNAAEL
jgi:glycosyltransferase involved in cell wall biosynthesis